MAVLLKTTVGGTLSFEGLNSINTTQGRISLNNSSNPELLITQTTINALKNHSYARFGSVDNQTITYIYGNSSSSTKTPHIVFYNTSNGATNPILSKINFKAGSVTRASINTEKNSDDSTSISIRRSISGYSEKEAIRIGSTIGSKELVTKIKNITYIDNLNLKASNGSEIKMNTSSTGNPVTKMNSRLIVYGGSVASGNGMPYTINHGAVAIIQADRNYTSGLHILNPSVSLSNYNWWTNTTTFQKAHWTIYTYSSTILRFDLNGLQRGYINANNTNQNLAFTGQHRSTCLDELQKYKDKAGLIVVSVGTYNNLLGYNNIEINEALPNIELSTIRKQKNVFGVISDSEDLEDTNRKYNHGAFGSVSLKKAGESDTRIIINSVGEGAIWVCNVNGNLKNGDYITTCEIPGYGMKQDDESLANYTVAKITCDCDFDLNSDLYECKEIEWEGKLYYCAFVGCTYHCG